MPLPDTIAVKMSSDAGEVSQLTRVAVQQMPMRELLGRMLGLTGKDEAAVCRVLARGSLVTGAIRMRWESLEVTPQALLPLLAQFPDSDPTRVFSPETCSGVILSADLYKIEIPRDVATPCRLLKKRSYWDALMEVATAPPQLHYMEYSYRLRSDRYRRTLLVDETKWLKLEIEYLTHQGLARQILETDFRILELFTSR